MLEKNIILIIEDELGIRRFLKTALRNRDYQLLETSCGHEGIQLALDNKPDLILLDLGLPDIDGIDVIKKIREWATIPIIVLSARDQENTKVKALDLGADDYLIKPFGIEELNARIRVALRHAERMNEQEATVFQSGDLQIDLVNREIRIKGERCVFSPTQYAILAALVRRANKIVTHKQLLRETWGENHVEDIDYLRIYIHQLRQKLEKDPAHPKLIKTEVGVGYRLMTS
jgi:two-component system KDP operon response regulator KdpE